MSTEESGNHDDNDDRTDKIDFVRQFIDHLGISIQSCGHGLETLAGNLASFTPARRRSALFGVVERIEDLERTLADARGIVREQMAQLSVDLNKR